MADHDVAPSPGKRSTTPLLSVQRQRRGPAVVIQFTGEVDMQSAQVMHEALTVALTDAAPPHPIVLDLTGIGFFGSAGMAELLQAHHHAVDRDIPLRIVASSRAVLRPLEVTGLTNTLDIRRDVTSALVPATPRAR